MGLVPVLCFKRSGGLFGGGIGGVEKCAPVGKSSHQQPFLIRVIHWLGRIEVGLGVQGVMSVISRFLEPRGWLHQEKL